MIRKDQWQKRFETCCRIIRNRLQPAGETDRKGYENMEENNLYPNNVNDRERMNPDNTEPESIRENEQSEPGNQYFDHVDSQSAEPVYEQSTVWSEGPVPAEPVKKKKKIRKQSGGFLRRAACAAVLAAIFGGVAGGTFYGICRYTGVLDKAEVQVPVVSQQLPRQEEPVARINTTDVQLVTTDVSNVVEEVIPAMVTIVNTRDSKVTNFWGQTFTREEPASGSGIIISENENELLIVTNHHVAEDAKNLEITFIDGNTAEAKIKGMDSEMDLAVLSLSMKDLSEETKKAIAIAQMGDSDELKLGQPAIVIGNALGIGISVTDGIISGLEREMTSEDGSKGTFIQTNAAVNHGNSGGALLNIKGEVVGIVSSKIDGYSVEGMGYAIPINAASPIISDLMVRETRSDKIDEKERGYLGIINPQAVNEEAQYYYNMPAGLYIVEVAEGSAAEKAGIVKGDIITKVEGEKITSFEDITGVLQYYKAGETIKITVNRFEAGEYVPHELTATLGKRPE